MHTHQKRELQKLCRTTGRILGPVGNEDTSVFKAPTPRTFEKALRGDTVLYPTALTLCADANAARKGAIIDTSVRTPLAANLNASREHNAALHPSIAAEIGEQEKVAHHQGRYDASRAYSMLQFKRLLEDSVSSSVHLSSMSVQMQHMSRGARHNKWNRREYTHSLIYVALCQ